MLTLFRLMNNPKNKSVDNLFTGLLFLFEHISQMTNCNFLHHIDFDIPNLLSG